MSYNVNAMNAYQQYGSSMAAGGGGTNMSGSSAKQGLGTKPSDAYKQYAETMTAGGGGQTMAGTGTSAYQQAQQMAGSDNDNSPARLYKNSANAFTNSGVNLKDQTWTPSADPRLIYNENKFKTEEIVTDVKDYLRGTAIEDALLEAQGFEAPRSALYTGENRPLTEQELQQYKPLFDLMDDSIEVEELSRMDREDQEALLEAIGVGNLGRMPRDTAFLGGDFDVATTNQQFIRDAVRAKNIAELKNMSKAFPDDASIQKDIQDLLNKIQGEENETAPVVRPEMYEDMSTPVSPTDTITDDADGGAATSGKGLMSPRLDGKDGDLAAYVRPFTVTEEELYSFATESFPDNPLAAGALLATIEAESAGGDSMLESGNYTKESALKVAYQGTYKTARKKEVEKIFNNPDLTYTDKDGNIRMTKEGQVKFFNIYYNDKYRGKDYKLGNTKEGDGFRFRGRGPIQLTGKNNYKKYGDMIGVDLVQNPHLVVTDKDVALAVTKAYMKDKGLNNVRSASQLRNIVGHADDEEATKAKARWKRAKEIQRKVTSLAPSTSLRPRSRPDTVVASN